METGARIAATQYAVGTPVSPEEYERFALADHAGVQWELHRGRLREKPRMSVEHNWLMFYAARLLQAQLGPNHYRLRSNGARLRRSDEGSYIPDVAVIPAALERELRRRPGSVDLYAVALPLVVEIWSPSTGSYDVNTKLRGYRQRGDAEIWRLHPDERTLTAWRRQPDGSYLEARFTGGTVLPVALPGVTIDLDRL